jgi:hypothetical protein
MIGDAILKVKNGNGTVTNITLKDVLYVPEASSNLISVGKLLQI